MKISIVTVCYNAERTIEQTIYSVINQTYKDIEYIIVDGKSNDKTLNIINKYRKNISCFISEKDTGIYNAMNKGIKLATGEYIHFLNADDALVNKNIIKNIVGYLKKDKEIDILSAPVYLVDEENKIQTIFSNLKDILTIPHQGMFCKRNILLKYLFDEKLKISGDYEFILRCFINKKKFCFINEPVAFYSNAGISTINDKIIQLEHEYIFNKYKENQYDNKYILKKYQWRDKIKKITKKIFNDYGMLKYVLKLKGWKKHRCDNKYCRWCGGILANKDE